jgi:hypothetical protein
VLDEGVPNVAIHLGDSHWVHNRAGTPLEPGRWHHVAVVCDPRLGGTIRFYLDGRRDAEHPLELGIPLDLEQLHVGAYSEWERSPGNNFHGTVDEVRVYAGMLTDEQVAALAGPPRRK